MSCDVETWTNNLTKGVEVYCSQHGVLGVVPADAVQALKDGHLIGERYRMMSQQPASEPEVVADGPPARSSKLVTLRIEDDEERADLLRDIRDYPDNVLLTPTQENRVHATVVRRDAADDHQHCPVGCTEGACETCPCCDAGWCVYGLDGIPAEDGPESASEDAISHWWAVAAKHNPVILATVNRAYSAEMLALRNTGG